MIAIERKDNKMWAIPGGMVDGDEKVSQTLKREFTEEALNSAGCLEIDNYFMKITLNPNLSFSFRNIKCVE